MALHGRESGEYLEELREENHNQNILYGEKNPIFNKIKIE